MKLNLHVRHAEPGEEATHFYHARTGSVLSREALAESKYAHDCVLPCMVSVPAFDDDSWRTVESQADVDAGYELERQDAAAGHP